MTLSLPKKPKAPAPSKGGKRGPVRPGGLQVRHSPSTKAAADAERAAAEAAREAQSARDKARHALEAPAALTPHFQGERGDRGDRGHSAQRGQGRSSADPVRTEKAPREVLLMGFAVCPSGLEAEAAQELAGLDGVRESQAVRGGVQFRGTAEAFFRANLWCRIPTRILLMLDQVRLRGPEDLAEAARRIPWEQFIRNDQTFRVDVNQGRSPGFALSLGFAALKVKDGLCDHMRALTGARPSVETHQPDHRVWLFVDQDKATLSIDTSGEPLFKRGWRQSKGEAPLRENLAAALVAMTRHDPEQALLDPFCGSGTLVIEAVQRLAGLAPGFCPTAPRQFACERFQPQSPFGRVKFVALRGECARAWQQGAQFQLQAPVIGRDLVPGLVEIAEGNARRALPPGLSDQIQWGVGDFLRTPAPELPPGLVVSNPPYGRRLQLHDTRTPDAADEPQGDDLRRLSEVMKQGYAGWTFFLLSDDLKLDASLRLKASQRIPVFNGDLDCRWMRFDMVAGSAR